MELLLVLRLAELLEVVEFLEGGPEVWSVWWWRWVLGVVGRGWGRRDVGSAGTVGLRRVQGKQWLTFTWVL